MMSARRTMVQNTDFKVANTEMIKRRSSRMYCTSRASRAKRTALAMRRARKMPKSRPDSEQFSQVFSTFIKSMVSSTNPVLTTTTSNTCQLMSTLKNRIRST
eukprot:Skav213714  [mRNA]  locus=scaffold549:102414:108608:- [translate_table: standard]